MTNPVIDVMPLLAWMILAVGGALLALLIWVGQRLQAKVDELPAQVSMQVKEVHAEIVTKMAEMNATHGRLERDVREQLTLLDRRVTRLEVSSEIHHGKITP